MFLTLSNKDLTNQIFITEGIAEIERFRQNIENALIS